MTLKEIRVDNTIPIVWVRKQAQRDWIAQNLIDISSRAKNKSLVF